ncbi:type II toxin-antitoxin system Phd/YefM family antitoxin [Streptomyces sp. NPDC004134]|uniref:type II toxin-antitoxin system Phd/YefM family antitoxin n=1 Tax=Streptomyces sp. NPDC004134 TaxID=3364691 RepID=UPI003695053A
MGRQPTARHRPGSHVHPSSAQGRAESSRLRALRGSGPLRTITRGGDAVLMSADDFDAWQETVYLLRSQANARRLRGAVARDRADSAAVSVSAEEPDGPAGGQTDDCGG